MRRSALRLRTIKDVVLNSLQVLFLSARQNVLTVPEIKFNLFHIPFWEHQRRFDVAGALQPSKNVNINMFNEFRNIQSILKSCSRTFNFNNFK